MPFRDVFGHNHLVALLERSIAGGTLPPSLLFAGPSGIGKRTTAVALAQTLNCLAPRDGDACGVCAACTRIARGVHPDHHSLGINPKDSRHMLIGCDGGFYATFDKGETWDHLNILALGQFYHVAVDNKKPYNVYGGLQEIDGKPVIYSMGNFIFDQYWSTDTMEGALTEITLQGNRVVQIRLHPYVILDQSQPNLLNPATDDGKQLLKEIRQVSDPMGW